MIDYCKLVNIDLGTDSSYRESNGNTLPNVQFPFGNQAYVLQTNKSKGGWFYEPRANYIEGIRVSSQPSPWLGDYGHLTIMPYTGEHNIDLHSSISDKLHFPDMMSFYMNKYNIKVKLIPTRYGAKLKIENNESQSVNIEIDLHENKFEYKQSGQKIYITIHGGPDEEFGSNYRKYYILDINFIKKENSENIECYQNDNKLILKTQVHKIELNLVSSLINYEYANFHLKTQSKSSFNESESIVKRKWNEYLGTIKIEEDDLEVNELFYSNLYRCLCYPRVISELGEDNKEVYFNFKNMEINKGTMISDCGFWDTYRTTIPLYKLIYPDIYKMIVNSILNYYKSYEWLPRWISPYERGIMPSTLVDSVIATAVVDGTISNKEDIHVAIEALLKNGTIEVENKLFGRTKLKEYIKNGFVATKHDCESVSLSLDNYYCDYAIYRALEHVGHERTEEFKLRAMQYKILFNPLTKYFEPKTDQGTFLEKYNPIEWGTDFCESSAKQNNFNVVHDVNGMIKLFGGKENVKTRLDLLMTGKPKYDTGKYGFEIHEMTELAKIDDLGYFAISNQPSFILPFWYLIIDEDASFYYIIDKTMNYFRNEFDGYPGDEDNGSLAAWYILVSIGKYPFCPVDGYINFKSRLKFKILIK